VAVERGPTGEHVTVSTVGDEVVRAFVPRALPPTPPLDVDPALRDRLDRAHLALGRLDSTALVLPSLDLFLYAYVRKEAVLSSQIEGTQSTLADLLTYELDQAPGAPLDDVREVSNYVAALEHGLQRLRGGFPLSGRLIREIHEVLLRGGRGATKDPGSFRRSQNWLGGTRPGDSRFVPPPPDRVPDLIGALERFMHDQDVRTPTLLKAAMAHVQFETIHPFLDGNGRVGRVLITLILCAEGVLREPLLYLSLFLKQHRDHYYQLLTDVRTKGDWEAWLGFFAAGVLETADGAVTASQRMLKLFVDDRQRIGGLGRIAGSALRVHEALQRRPLATIPRLVKATGLTKPTVAHALEALGEANLVRETTGKERDRVFSYTRYLAMLSEGTEPL
jgi:Fic family protein